MQQVQAEETCDWWILPALRERLYAQVPAAHYQAAARTRYHPGAWKLSNVKQSVEATYIAKVVHACCLGEGF